MKHILTSLFADVTNFAADDDLIHLTVESGQLDYPIVLPFVEKRALTVERFLSEIERVLQSHEEFVLDQGLVIGITHARKPVGGRGAQFWSTFREFLHKKQCIIRITNADELCCARAIVTAKARLEKHSDWNSIRLGREIQRKLALQLHSQANVPHGKCGIDEIKKFQALLQDHQIIVVSFEHMNSVIFSGPEQEEKICLYLHDGHFDLITSMSAFYNSTYFCFKCNKGYAHRESHKCNNACRCCHKIHSEEGPWTHCIDCNRYFAGKTCFDMHKNETKAGNSTCSNMYRCKDCGQNVHRSKQKNTHRCGEIYCNSCSEHVMPGHKCFIKPIDEIKEQDTTFIFFDFECTQDKQVSCEQGYAPHPETNKCTNCCRSTCGSFEHQPNLCIAQKVCGNCLKKDVDDNSTCMACGPNQKIFYGANTVVDFCTWLFSKQNKGATVLCHNFKGYDSYPILQFCYQNGIKPKIIPNGTKIMSMEIPAFGIRFIDSLNFLPTALANLPKMFGKKELCKGYFPHLINKSDNQDLVLDKLPDASFYGADTMKPDERAKFIDWHTQNKNTRFVLKDELIRYCKSDVDILRQCCLHFRDLFMAISSRGDGDCGVDALQSCITIASACNLLFRRNFLEPETIARMPAHGYRFEENQSLKALKWLSYVGHSTGQYIHHARNGGEHRVGSYKLDGYYENNGRKFGLEFHGCFWHGCPKCYSRDTVNAVNGKRMSELYQLSLDKQRFVVEQGYHYTCKWECEFKADMENNKAIAEYVIQLDLIDPLQPRDAFFGGRTEAFSLHETANENTALNYFDVTSLYPWVNKYGKYPLGHPEIITDNFQDLASYEGLIKVRVLPPRELYMPVLPLRTDCKLMFPLCRTCAMTQQQTPCEHPDTQRAFVGTWVTDELKKAVAVGYRVLQIHEVWHYSDVSQYNPETGSGGLFAGYINTFAKIKQESSDWPAWCTDDDKQQAYIDDYSKKEGK